MFGLKNAPTTFQRMVQKILWDYKLDFMKVCVYDFSLAKERDKHLFQLRLCLQRCKDTNLKLNLEKCAFAIRIGVLLGHIIFEEGLAVDSDKVRVITKMKALENLKELERFIGKVKWHSKFIKYLAHVACLLYQLTKKSTMFEWTEECQRAF